MASKDVILYGVDISPPTRCVLLTAKALGIRLDYRIVNLLAGEHKTEEFIKNNPQHTVPTLNDNGFIVWDSHAIAAYLVTKYGPKHCPLYPTNPETRALIDQRLHFDSGILFARLRVMMEPVFFFGQKEVEPAAVTKVYEAYDFLEAFLKSTNTPYLVGDNLTIADFSCVSSVNSLETVCPIEESKYPYLTAWLIRCKEIPYYDETNKKGVNDFLKAYKMKTGKA